MNLGALTKQVGPLPLGVWLLAGGGGLFIAWRKSANPAPAVPPAAGDALPTGGGTGGQVSSWDGAPVVLSPIIRVPAPRVEIVNIIPVPAPVPVVAPRPLPVPPAPPRVAPKPVAKKPAPKPVAKKPAAKPVKRYTVKSGDTLWKIAGGVRWPVVYAANRSVIEAAAKAHGRASSGGGHWIYPGTVLVIP